MSKNSAAARGFLGSLVLLLGALVVFFVVLYPENGKDTPAVVRDSTKTVEVGEGKRQAMRSNPSQRASGGADDEQTFTASEQPPSRAGATGDGSTVAPGDDPEDPEIQRAINLVDAGSVSEALQVLEGVLKRDPKNEQALVEMAMIQLLDLKQIDQAVGYLQRVMDVNPQNHIALSELVSLYEEQGRVEEGLAFMQDVATRHPGSPELSHGVGQLLTLAGRDQEAIAYYEKATASPEYQVRAYRDLAEAYSKTGDSEKAIESYGRAVSEQEQEIAEKAGRGLPIQFAEERLAYTKLEMARELIRTGEIERAETIIEEIDAVLPGDETITALRDSIRQRKAG